jgi:hypothetical protein
MGLWLPFRNFLLEEWEFLFVLLAHGGICNSHAWPLGARRA